MLRKITLGEMAMAKTISGNSMSYNVWVHCDSYLPFGMQSDNVVSVERVLACEWPKAINNQR